MHTPYCQWLAEKARQSCAVMNTPKKRRLFLKLGMRPVVLLVVKIPCTTDSAGRGLGTRPVLLVVKISCTTDSAPIYCKPHISKYSVFTTSEVCVLTKFANMTIFFDFWSGPRVVPCTYVCTCMAIPNHLLLHILCSCRFVWNVYPCIIFHMVMF